MLVLLLTDGRATCKALEFKPTPALNADQLAPGTKLCVEDAMVSCGILLLTPKCVKVQLLSYAMHVLYRVDQLAPGTQLCVQDAVVSCGILLLTPNCVKVSHLLRSCQIARLVWHRHKGAGVSQTGSGMAISCGILLLIPNLVLLLDDCNVGLFLTWSNVVKHLGYFCYPSEA